jgi:hypothetical protein
MKNEEVKIVQATIYEEGTTQNNEPKEIVVEEKPLPLPDNEVEEPVYHIDSRGTTRQLLDSEGNPIMVRKKIEKEKPKKKNRDYSQII